MPHYYITSYELWAKISEHINLLCTYVLIMSPLAFSKGLPSIFSLSRMVFTSIKYHREKNIYICICYRNIFSNIVYLISSPNKSYLSNTNRFFNTNWSSWQIFVILKVSYLSMKIFPNWLGEIICLHMFVFL